MQRYRLTLYHHPGDPPVTEYLSLASDEDALDIAQIALLATQDYTHVVVHLGRTLIGRVERDACRPRFGAGDWAAGRGQQGLRSVA